MYFATIVKRNWQSMSIKIAREFATATVTLLFRYMVSNRLHKTGLNTRKLTISVPTNSGCKMYPVSVVQRSTWLKYHWLKPSSSLRWVSFLFRAWFQTHLNEQNIYNKPENIPESHRYKSGGIILCAVIILNTLTYFCQSNENYWNITNMRLLILI